MKISRGKGVWKYLFFAYLAVCGAATAQSAQGRSESVSSSAHSERGGEVQRYALSQGRFEVRTYVLPQEKRAAGAPHPQTGAATDVTLSGTFCTLSATKNEPGSENGYTYSNWARFDGNGRFRYGSKLYYRAEGHQPRDLYANERAGRFSGTYTVEKDRIVFRLPDGSTAEAKVYWKTEKGEIRGFQYGKLLYFPELCD